MDEIFIWKAINLYKVNHYIHYGPIKTFKTKNLWDGQEFKEGHLFNRELFHASKSAIPVIWWKITNANKPYESIELNSINPRTKEQEMWTVHKTHRSISELNVADKTGELICVIEARNYSFQSPRLTGSINDGGKYGSKWTNKDNLLIKLPLFCAARSELAERGNGDFRYIDTVYKSSDGGKKYQTDKTFLNHCANYVYFTQKNDCSENNKIWNVIEEKAKFDDKLLKLSNEVLKKAGIDRWIGLKNIDLKYNTTSIDTFGSVTKDNPQLNLAIVELKDELKKYYSNKIESKLFEYELLK